MSSKSHHSVHCPWTMNASPGLVPLGVTDAASSVARSPGYWRITTGFPDVPATVARNFPRYVPPCSQTVSPGWILPDAPLSAKVSDQGWPSVPALLELPVGETCHPRCEPGGGGGGGGGGGVPGCTCTWAWALRPLLSAVIVALPESWLVITPDEDTVATIALSMLHATFVGLTLSPVWVRP